MKPAGHAADNRARVRVWLNDQHARAAAYLLREQAPMVELNSRPAWFVAPCLAFWRARRARLAVEDVWIVTGDVPTDHLRCARGVAVREVARQLGTRWQRVAGNMLAGRPDPEVEVGDRAHWAELGDLLARRSRILLSWAADDRYWSATE